MSKKSRKSAKARSAKTTKKSTAPKLSILVPVYNVEKYLALCLETILNQAYKDCEVLLIDDGSTDSSPEILKKYAEKDSRLKIFTRKNAGYGAALNFALSQAKGKYIAIIEPDDFIHRDIYKILIPRLEKTGADIAKCSFNNYYGKTGKNFPERVFHESHFLKPDETGELSATIIPQKEQSVFLVDPSIWSCVYRREFLEINHIKFLETPGASFQDSGFQFKTFAFAEKIYCLEKPLYYYLRDNASSSVKSVEKVMYIKQEFDSVDNFCAGKFTEVSAACRFRSYIWNLNRLKLGSALKFAGVMKADYKTLKNRTSFRAKFYVKHHLARAHECTFAVRFPKIYVFLRPIFKFYNFVKHSLYKLFKNR